MKRIITQQHMSSAATRDLNRLRNERRALMEAGRTALRRGASEARLKTYLELRDSLDTEITQLSQRKIAYDAGYYLIGPNLWWAFEDDPADESISAKTLPEIIEEVEAAEDAHADAQIGRF